MASTPACIKNRNFFLVLQFISMGLLYVSNGVPWYFGNVAVYVNSYWYHELRSSKLYTQWVLSIFIIVWVVSLILGGILVNKTSPRVVTFIGISLFNAGLFISYFTVQYSPTLFIASFGSLQGIGQGFIHSELVSRVSQIIRKNHAVALAAVSNYLNFGALVFNIIITWYVNPIDAEAKIVVSNSFTVFSEKSIIDRVPSLFLLLGIITSSLNITGFMMSVLLKHRGKPEDIEKVIYSSKGKGYGTVEGGDLETTDDIVFSLDDFGDSGPDKVHNLPMSLSTSNKKSMDTCGNLSSETHERLRCDCDINNPPFTKTENKMKPKSSDAYYGDLDRTQMLRIGTFYVLWLILIADDLPYVIIANFYKIFGEVWIRDDHFLTQMSMASLVCVFVVRFAWAIVVDRFGIKVTQVILNSSIVLSFSFYYFLPQVDRWLFAIMTCLIAAMCSSIYIMFPLIVMKLFGKKHVASNFGILLTGTIALNLALPSVSEYVLNTLGWSGIFLGTGMVNALALIGTVVGLPNDI